MKYILLLTILISCNSNPDKVIVYPTEPDPATLPPKPDSNSTDQQDPFETDKDLSRLNNVMDEISRFPEVEAINKQINKKSKGKHGVSIMIQDDFNGDDSYYHFPVGDNSNKDRYMKVYDFLMHKKTGEIKAYDPALDAVMSLEEWRMRRK